MGKAVPWNIDHLIDHPEVLGALLLLDKEPYASLMDGFDRLLLVVTDNANCHMKVVHNRQNELTIQEIWIFEEHLSNWFENVIDARLIQWLLRGQLVYDRDGKVKSVVDNIAGFPEEIRKKRICMEYGRFLRLYMESKTYQQEGQMLDAFNTIQCALQHWARITVIKAGQHPEIKVWHQVKEMNPGVYKLYEELVHGEESVDKRVQLALLAAEFSLLSSMEENTRFLIELLASRSEPWSIGELLSKIELHDLRRDLPILLGNMAERSLVCRVCVRKYDVEEHLYKVAS